MSRNFTYCGTLFKQTTRNLLIKVKIDCVPLKLASHRKDVKIRLLIAQNDRIIFSLILKTLKRKSNLLKVFSFLRSVFSNTRHFTSDNENWNRWFQLKFNFIYRTIMVRLKHNFPSLLLFILNLLSGFYTVYPKNWFGDVVATDKQL